MKDWNVWVCRDGRSRVIGKVSSQSEPLARCAALSRYGAADEEVASGEVLSVENAILPEDDFWVSLA